MIKLERFPRPSERMKGWWFLGLLGLNQSFNCKNPIDVVRFAVAGFVVVRFVVVRFVVVRFVVAGFVVL